ncbi:MgtC/SapB family protein [Caenispirillum bisanense]|uniref:Protein MgtC n=1 Tax=Caenispirillum bisanense TaxID=414052 RepID=A0A286GST5_9PROT|nr:MgtC/SapB family protein [Caenispirillum bisanense]SOD98024.1 putative Mg2+ transporter-C (MgtC) family protein [Caenispirillum bisanense]
MNEILQASLETHLPFEDIAVRLAAALVLGGAIGLNREWLQKPAGLRTHIMVSLAAATFGVLAREMFMDAVEEGGQPDPVRVVEAVVTGVAFLGAGTIIQQSGGKVAGMTTGASIWLAGAIGVACGTGHLSIAALCTGLGLVVLVAVNWFETLVVEPMTRRRHDGVDADEERSPGGEPGDGGGQRADLLRPPEDQSVPR